MKKRLLFIHNKLVCGGAESALLSLLTLLDKERFEITVFVLNDGGDWDQKFQNAGIRVIHASSRMEEGKRLRNFILRKRVDYARRRRGRNLIRTAVAEEFDLVVGYHVPAAYMCAGLELAAGKIRYIHGDARKDHVLRGNVTASLACLRKQDRIVCVSGEAARAFTQITGIRDTVGVCYNPIDSEAVCAGAQESPPEALPGKYICAVGRLSREKGFERLIRIHKRLHDEGLEHSLVIVGDGPEKEKLLRLVEELDARESVILTGYRSNPYCYMKRSLFTVCSSYTEGLPVIAMESLCLGVPIVSAYPSVGELFGDECCGIITENGDDSLEAGLREMLTNTALYRNTVAGAKARSAAFSSKTMVAEVERLFDAVMEGRKA